MAELIAKVTAWVLSLKPVRVWFHFLERRGLMLADSITYRALFSDFAGVLLGFTLASLWLADNPAAWAALVNTVDAAIPGLLGEDGIIELDAIKAPTGLTLTGDLRLHDEAGLVALEGNARAYTYVPRREAAEEAASLVAGLIGMEEQ